MLSNLVNFCPTNWVAESCLRLIVLTEAFLEQAFFVVVVKKQSVLHPEIILHKFICFVICNNTEHLCSPTSLVHRPNKRIGKKVLVTFAKFPLCAEW